MTDLLGLHNLLHRAHCHGITITPGDPGTGVVIDLDRRIVAIPRDMHIARWTLAVERALGVMLPVVAAGVPPSMGATALAVEIDIPAETLPVWPALRAL